MAVGAEIPPARPALVLTVRVRAEMADGVALASSPSRRLKTWGWSCGGVRARGGGVLTGVAVRLCGEARKGCGLTLALASGWRRGSSGTGARPHPLEHEAQPKKGYQHELGAKQG